MLVKRFINNNKQSYFMEIGEAHIFITAAYA